MTIAPLDCQVAPLSVDVATRMRLLWMPVLSRCASVRLVSEFNGSNSNSSLTTAYHVLVEGSIHTPTMSQWSSLYGEGMIFLPDESVRLSS